jgi:hypothetical protein
MLNRQTVRNSLVELLPNTIVFGTVNVPHCPFNAVSKARKMLGRSRHKRLELSSSLLGLLAKIKV